MFELFLVSLLSDFGTEVLIWCVGVLLFLGMVVLFIYQRRQGRELESELEQLGKVKKHNIEYELVLKAMRLCTWHIDVAERTITYDNDYRERNDSFVPMPGTSLDDLVALMADSDRSRIRKALDDICSGRTEEYHEISRVKAAHNNSLYWTEAYATVASRDADGLPKTIVGTSMVIDDRKRMETALVEARNKAEESDRLKSAFIANMSHEIRTPLNAIIGFTSVLPDIDSREERQELINLIQENNQKLLRIIDDVMNISKIEAGKEQLQMATFDINVILDELVSKFVPRVKAGVTLSTQYAAPQQDVTTDLTRVMETLEHLLSNAVKFTDQGSIVLGYDAVSNHRLHLWVRDTGKGVAPENHERIFERFFKVDEFIPGAGLGLSLCRVMAFSLGGQVGVESKLGEGSTFWLDIPA